MTKCKSSTNILNTIFVILIILWLLPVCVFVFDMAAYTVSYKFIIIDWSVLRTSVMFAWTVILVVIFNAVKNY